MRLESEVCVGRAQAPNLDAVYLLARWLAVYRDDRGDVRAIQTSCRKGVGVFGIYGNAHDVVGMALKHLHALPALLPVPQLDCHVIGRRQDEGLGGMHGNGAQVVGMRLELRNLLRGVVVVNSDLEIIGTANNPVLAGDEATASHRDVGQLKGLDDLLGFVGPDGHMA